MTGYAEKPPVGLIGWGRMGSPMGHRLLAAGYPVSMADPSESARADAAGAGAVVLESPRQVAARTDVVITMLPDGPAARQVAFDDVTGVIAGLKPGSLWLEMTSSEPEVTRAIAETVERVQVDFVDAPVTGGVPKAQNGALTVMVAGPDAAVDRAQPILEHLAASIFRVGRLPGMGDVAKTVNNLLSAANLLAAAEGLALAVSYGIDPVDLLEVLNSGTGQSNATAWKIPQYVLTGSYDSGFTVGQYLKDLDIALGVADGQRLPLELGRSAAASWRRIAEEMHQADHTEVVRAVLEANGVNDPNQGDHS